MREVLNAIFDVPSTGCQWSALLSDLPPHSIVQDYLDLRIVTAQSSASITNTTSNAASRQAEKQT